MLLQSLLPVLLALAVPGNALPINEKRGLFSHKVGAVTQSDSIQNIQINPDLGSTASVRVGSRNTLQTVFVDTELDSVVIASSKLVLPKPIRWNYKYLKSFHKMENATFNQNYGGLKLKGISGTDTLTLLDSRNNAYQIPNTKLDVATSGTKIGILGLGPDSVLFSNATDKFYKTKSYGLHLSSTRDNSILLLGAPALSQISGELTYTPLKEHGQFEVSLKGNITGSANSFNAILLSNNKKIQLPLSVFQTASKMYGTYSDDQRKLIVDCGVLGPDLTFVIGDANVTVPYSSLLKVESEKKNICLVKLGPAYDNVFHLGEPFLRNTYAYVDYTNQKIGFATPSVL